MLVDAEREHTRIAAIERVELGGLWWSPEQLSKGVWTTPGGLPKKTYVRFKDWTYNDDQDPPYPNVVYVICRVRSDGASPLDLRVSATVRDFDVRKLIDGLGEKGEWPWRLRITTLSASAACSPRASTRSK